MRKLKFHEKKLLKKVNFLEWKREGGQRENLVIHRYHVTGRDDYKKYSSLCRMVQKLVNILKQMDSRDPFRIEMTDALIEKLYLLGILNTKPFVHVEVCFFCESKASLNFRGISANIRQVQHGCGPSLRVFGFVATIVGVHPLPGLLSEIYWRLLWQQLA
ncbi:UNVERIFIED_CONTAM: U3 small nucleolar ribonucleoprotein IMP3 [Sesamum calycinum]|uniref:U3 small nucleolar ribonucleoprotein IMP3 n=1 Tax=Sesamum calycinum TaxID=2727403 RepID=A0AAW2MKW8_9LAMI